MPRNQTIELKAAGLFTNPSRLNLPPGALLLAENAVISRPGITSRRRGFFRSAALDNPGSALGQYLGSLLVLDGTTLKYGSGDLESWTPITGSHSPPSGGKLRFLESNGNLYFLTSVGPKVIDSLSATPVRAGIPQGLDSQLSLTGTGASWFLPNTQVGYSHLWKRTDANNNAKAGAPSFQERIANSYRTATWSRSTTTATFTLTGHGFLVNDVVDIADSTDEIALPNGSYTVQTAADANTFTLTVPNAGGASGSASVGKSRDVSVTVTVPAEIIAGDVLELYRTPLSASDDDSPGDDHRLIISHTVTSTDVSTGTITLTDDNDPAFFLDNLYTNQGLEGRSQANARPPLAKHVVQFEEHTFYFDAVQPHTLKLQLLDVAGITDDTDAITLTLGGTGYTFTFSTAENQGSRKFKRTTSGLLAANLEATTKSLQKIINRDPDVPFTAHYISGEDDAPGILLLEVSTLGTGALTATANDSGTGAVFSPILPTSGTTVASTNNAKPNGAWRSKAGQPEAVPVLNTHLFGKKNKAISGVLSLKEAILVFKDDGLFDLSGQTDGLGGFQFDVDETDPTIVLAAANTLASLDNAAFGFTTQGVIRAPAGAPAIVSRPQIEEDLRRLSKFPLFSSLAHAVAYESDRKYLFFLPERTVDETCTIAYVYDYSSNAWTTWRKPVSCGHVLDDRLFLAHAIDPYILIERKSFSATGADFVDEDIPVTVTAVSTTTDDDGDTVSLLTLTYSYSGADLAAGFLFEQGSARSIIEAVALAGPNTFSVTLRSHLSSVTTGAATLGLPIGVKIEWAPETAGNPASLKQFPFCQIYLENPTGTHFLSFRSDMQPAFEAIDSIQVARSVGWGFGPWGEFAWGDGVPGESQVLRTYIPRDQQMARAISVRYNSREARVSLDILALSLDVHEISTTTERQPT